jgi:hypothetical protein
MRYYCTLFDKNYMVKGLALYASLLEHAQPFGLYILALDDETFWLLCELNLPQVSVIPLGAVESKLGLVPVRQSRNWMEYCWTLASQFMEYVFQVHGKFIGQLTYLDSDLFFYSSPDPIFREMDTASTAIIPHRFHRGNARLLVNGVYNVGWLTINHDVVGLDCLTKWATQCRNWCFHRNEDGKFGDQAYLDSWPYDYGSACKVINHIGAGLAPWNVFSYDIGQNDTLGTWVSAKLDQHEPIALQHPLAYSLIFYHFHEFTHDPGGNPTRLTRHPHNADHKRLIYGPYIQAIRTAARQMNEAVSIRQAKQNQLKTQGERA